MNAVLPQETQHLIRKRHEDKNWMLAYWCSDAHGRPSNGGGGDPVKPDTIQTVEGELDICPDPPETVGLHATTEPHRWRGDRVWLVALKKPVKCIRDKVASKKRHILTNIKPSQVWSPKVAARLEMSNLWGADLRGADLRGANLQGADLRGADLRGSDLRGANLRGANLQGADLRGANLQGADLQDTDLGDANIREAQIKASQIVDAPINDWTVCPTIWDRSNYETSKSDTAAHPQPIQ